VRVSRKCVRWRMILCCPEGMIRKGAFGKWRVFPGANSWRALRQGSVRKRHPRMFYCCLTHGTLIREKDRIPLWWCFRTHSRASLGKSIKRLRESRGVTELIRFRESSRFCEADHGFWSRVGTKELEPPLPISTKSIDKLEKKDTYKTTR